MYLRKYVVQAIIVFLAISIPRATGIAIPNGVVGTPIVHCQENGIAVSFQTQSPFEGRIYVKGFAESTQCPRVFGDTQITTPEITLQFNEACGIRRIRFLTGGYGSSLEIP